MTNQTRSKKDDEYKKSIQPVVDEAMEAHNLAPAIRAAILDNKPLNDTLRDIIKSAIKEDRPLNEELQKVVVDTISGNKDAQSVLDEVVSSNEIIKKSKEPIRTKGYWIPIIVTGLIGIAGIIVSIVSVAVSLNK